MKRQFTATTRLGAWAKFNGVGLLNTRVKDTTEKGTGLFADSNDILHGPSNLIIVPKDLVLSQSLVEEYAKTDRHLREVLNAVGEFGRTARGAILIFLVLQITHSSPDSGEAVGVSNPLTEYVKFLPETVPLPTFWSDEERDILNGTSLAPAVEQKLRSLSDEFDFLREKTRDIAWCNGVWWDEDTGHLTVDDWKQVDAMYRSRALDLPGTGHAMVPCVDVANHASGDETMAVYDTDANGNAILQLRADKTLHDCQEITITYGDEKGACEMIFSYGFLEESQESAQELLLDLDIPNEDPLKLAKKFVNKEAPGFKIYLKDNEIQWEGPYVWWACVNQEDGLDFQVVQCADGSKELTTTWKNQYLDPSTLTETLKKDANWDVFQLRAIVTLETRTQEQLRVLERTADSFRTSLSTQSVDSDVWQTVQRLRSLEASLLRQASQSFQEQKRQLAESPVVHKYLSTDDADARSSQSEEDFS